MNYNLSDFISSAETGTNTGAGGSATAELEAILPPVVEKTFGPNPILSGGQSTLLITITNPNQDYDIQNLSFTDTFPATLINVTTTSGSACGGTYTTANGSPATLTLAGGSLLKGDSCQISVLVTSTDINPLGLTNSVTVNSTDAGNSNTASDTLFVRSPAGGMALLKQVSTSATGPWSDYVEVETGTNVYYRFVVENTGDVALTNVVINDATLGLTNYACVASLAVQAVDTCAAPAPVAALVGVNSNTATARDGSGTGTTISEPSTADYKGMDLEVIVGYIWKDNGAGGGIKEDAIKDGGEAQVNLATLDNTFVVIRDNTGKVLDVVQVCTSTGNWPTIGCTPGSWTTSVPAGSTGLTAYVTYPAAGNPLPFPGQTISTPFIGVSDSNFNLTGGNRTGGTPIVSPVPVITFDATPLMQVNFGIYRNNCAG